MGIKKIKKIILLQISFFIYALSAFFFKLATFGQQNSIKLIAFYLLGLVMLGIYAILWQQILKMFQLSVAFSNKGITIVWGLILGIIFFNEKITIGMILGVIIIVIGIFFINSEGVSGNE